MAAMKVKDIPIITLILYDLVKFVHQIFVYAAIEAVSELT